MVGSNTRMPRRFRFALPVLAALVVAVGLTACGGGGDGGPQNANTLLKQTFASGHSIKSGKVSASFTFDAQGIKQLQGPLSIAVSGPFESSGKGKLPKLDISLDIKSTGTGTATVGVVSTGDHGYLRLQSQAFVLDDATFAKLKNSYEQSASKSKGGGPSLKSLGIDPLHWLKNPTVAPGTESVGGADTYHVTAGVDVAAFAADLSTLLQKASALSSTTKLPSSLTAQQRQEIVSSVKSASLEVWTGKDDKTLRRLRLLVDIAVPPALRSRVGGMSTGKVSFDLTLADLNQPQEITAPSKAQPLGSLQALLGGAVGGGSGAGSAGAGTTGGGSGATGSGTAAPGSGASTKYLDCLAAAKGDVAKTQQCASLIGQ